MFSSKFAIFSVPILLLEQMIDINEMLKLSQGQGHKGKGQGQICNFVKKQKKKLASAMYHERMIRY